MSLPLTRFLDLETNGNVQTKNLLDKLVVNNQKGTFVAVTMKTLKISKTDAEDLFDTAQMISTILATEPKNEQNDMDEIKEKSPKPIHSHISTVLKEKENIMQSNKSIQFQQHSKMKSIYDIEDEKNSDSISTAIITEMQLQYCFERLDKIPSKVLTEEFKIREVILNVVNGIKETIEQILKSLNNEINHSTYLKKMIKKNKDHQVQRNLQTLCEDLLTVADEAIELQNLINDSCAQIKEYAMERDLIEEINNILYAKMNPKYKRVIDAKVTNFFLSNINTLDSFSEKLSLQFQLFNAHIQSLKYTKHAGSMANMRKILECKQKAKDDYNEMYRFRTNLKILFGNNNDLSNPYLNKIIKTNDKNLLKCIQCIEKEKQIQANNNILKHNKICINLVRQKRCVCSAIEHKIPDKIKNILKRKKSGKSENEPKKKKHKKDNKKKEIYVKKITKQSKEFENFFIQPNKNKNRRQSFGISKLSMS